MKKAFLLLFLTFPLMSRSQKIECPDFDRLKYDRLEFGFSVGNNGQYDRLFEEFYFSIESNYRSVTKNTNIKYSAIVRYFFSENISFRLRLGKAERKRSYRWVDYVQDGRSSFKQNTLNINPSVCFSKKINDFEISTGIEVPLIFVGDFEFSGHGKVFPDSIHLMYEQKENDKIDGGFIWGINNFISIKYFFGKKFSIGTEINYGLLSATLGNKRTTTTEYILPTQQTVVNQEVMKYKDIFFSPPEFSFGISYRL